MTDLYIELSVLFVEEILHSAEAIWMSSDGRMMLYASFNDSLVEEMHISWFGEGNKALYPDIRSLRYPKVRHTNRSSSMLQ